MQPRCTCGALLPEDARFCHKCGKPQYEEDIARIAEVETPPVRVTPPVPVEPSPASRISFRNSRAVLISILVAGGTIFGIGIAGMVLPILAPIVLCAAGFVAVLLYRKQSSEPMSTAAGARLGWMTGLWLFLVIMICVAVMSIYISNPNGREMLKSVASNPQIAKMLDNPHEFLVNLPFGIIQAFFMVTLLPGLGGILGAKLSARNRPSA